MSTSIEQRKKDLGLDTTQASSSTSTVAARKADLGIKEVTQESTTPSLSSYVMSQLISTGFSPAKNVLEPLMNADATRKANIEAAEKAATEAARSAVREAKRDSYEYNKVKQQQIADLQSAIAQSKSDASAAYAKAQSAKDATTRSFAYEKYANQNAKTAQLEDVLKKQGGKTTEDKIADYGKVVNAVLFDEGKLPELLDSIDVKLSSLLNRIPGVNIDTSKQLEEVQNIQQVRNEAVSEAKKQHNKLGQIALGGTEAASKMLGDVALWYASGAPAAVSYAAPAVETLGLSEAALGAGNAEKLATLTKRFGANVASDIMKGNGVNLAISASSGLSTYVNAVMKGASDENASKAGLMATAVEYFSNKLFAGTPLEDAGEEKGAVMDLVEAIVNKLGKSELLAKALNTAPGKIFSKLFDFFGEGVEEVVAGIADPLIAQKYYDPTQKLSRDQLADDFAVGVAMSVILGLPGTVTSAVTSNEATGVTVPYTAQTQQQTQTAPTLTEAAGVPFTNAAAQQTQTEQTAEPVEEQKPITRSAIDAIIKDNDALAALGIDRNGKTNSQLRAEVRAKLGAADTAEAAAAQPAQQVAEPTSMTLTEASDIPFTNSQETVQQTTVAPAAQTTAQQNTVLPTGQNGGIVEQNTQEGTVNAERNETDAATGAEAEDSSALSLGRRDIDKFRGNVFRRSLAGTQAGNGGGWNHQRVIFRDNRSADTQRLQPLKKIRSRIVTPKEGSAAHYAQKFAKEYGVQCYVIPHDVFLEVFNSQAPALTRHTDKGEIVYIDAYAGEVAGELFGGDAYLQGAAIGTHEALHAMFFSGFAPAKALADGLEARLTEKGKKQADKFKYESAQQRTEEFACAFATTYQKFLYAKENGLDSSKTERILDGLFNDGTTPAEFYEEISQVHDAWLAQFSSLAEQDTSVSAQTQTAPPAVQTQAQTASSDVQTQARNTTSVTPQYTGDETARTWNAEDRIAELQQEKKSIFARARAEQDAGKIGVSAKDLARLDEINTELQQLQSELDGIKATAQQRTQQDVDSHTPSPVDTETATTTQLRAELIRVEEAVKAETNPETAKLLQDYAQKLRDEIGARHGEAANAEAPAQTDAEAPAPKHGTMKESTSVPYGNPNGVEYESLTPEQAIEKAEDYVNNQLGDYSKTTEEKAELLQNIPNWAVEQEIASEILRMRALKEGLPVLARQLRDRHIAERSKVGQQLRDGYALQSNSERANIAANKLVNDVTKDLKRRLGEMKSEPTQQQAGKKIAKTEEALESLKKGLDETNDYIDQIDRAYHMDVPDKEKNQALRAIIYQIAEQRGHKYTYFANNAMRKMDDYHLYDIALSSAVGVASDAVPTGFFEGMNTIQYIAQLLNPQTIERNIIGNFAFGALENVVTGNVAAVVDHLFLSGTAARQTAIRNSETGAIEYKSPRKNYFVTAKSAGLFSKAARESAKKSAAGSIVRIQLDAPSGELGKYDTRSYQTFGGLFGSLEQLLSYGMATTDAFQSAQREGAIQKSLSGLQADNPSNRMTDKMKNEAARRGAAYSSWHRETELGTLAAAASGALNNLIGKGNSAGRTFKFNGREYKMKDFGAGDLIMKYGRFAGTAIQTAIEYTPLGVAKAVYNLSVMKAANRQIKQGGKADQIATDKNGKQVYGFKGLTNAETAVLAQREAAEAIARPIVGTTAAFAFAGLAKLGLLLLNNSDDDKDERQDKRNAGLKDLQINISALGRLVSGEDTTLQEDDLLMSVSDLAPFDTLVGIGVELANLKAEDELTFGAALGAMASGAAERFNDLSVMDAIQTYWNDIKYRDTKDEDGNDLGFWQQVGGAAKDIFADRMSSNITGFISGPVRKLASATDNHTRDTASDTALGEIWNNVRNSLPGLRSTLPEKMDAHGNPVSTGLNNAENVFNSLLAPYSTTRYHASDVQTLSQQTGKYPTRKAPNYYTVDGQRYTLSTEDKREWMADYGEAYDGVAELLLNSGNMDKLTDEQRTEIMSKIGSYATAVAKQNYLEDMGIPYTFTSNAAQMQKAVTAAESGIELADYFLVQEKHDEIDETNPGSAYDKATEFANWLDKQSWITDTQENILRQSMQFSGGFAAGAVDGSYDELKGAGISGDNAYKVYTAVSKLTTDDGTDVREWQKDEAIADLNISDSDKLKAMQFYAASSSKEALAEAVEAGYSFDEIVAFRRMKSELGKKSEMDKAYDDYGLGYVAYNDLYQMFS